MVAGADGGRARRAGAGRQAGAGCGSDLLTGCAGGPGEGDWRCGGGGCGARNACFGRLAGGGPVHASGDAALDRSLAGRSCRAPRMHGRRRAARGWRGRHASRCCGRGGVSERAPRPRQALPVHDWSLQSRNKSPSHDHDRFLRTAGAVTDTRWNARPEAGRRGERHGLPEWTRSRPRPAAIPQPRPGLCTN